MKLAKLANFLALAVILSLAAAGCKKGIDKTTHIPMANRADVQTEGPGRPRTGLEPGTTLPPTLPGDRSGIGTTPLPPPTGTTPGDITSKPVELPTTGIEASSKDFDNMDQDRETFKNQTVYFDFDKSNVKSKELGKLEEVARRMKGEFASKFLRIEGHCDERGTEEYNRALGDRRAQSVREQLVKLGLDPEKIQTITFGEEKPADPGHNEAAWSKNRRGEIILLTPRK